MATRIFYLYRYQLLPIDVQPTLLYDLKDLISKKNQYFHQAVMSLKESWKDPAKKRYSYDIYRHTEKSIMLIASRQKNVKLIREDHTERDVDSFPFGYVIIDNDKEHQIIAIQESTELRAKTILKKIEKALQHFLAKRYLIIKISPIYNEDNFWDFVSKHEEKITSLSFDLITPNMSNISSRLSEDLKKTAKATGTVETNLKFNAASKGTLKLSQDNHELDGLVNYAAQGGGGIFVKVKGARLGFDSNDFQLTLEVEDSQIKDTLENIITLMRNKANDGSNR